MRRWGIASVLCVLLWPLAASAQEAEVTDAAAPTSADEDVKPQVITYGALPGGLHAPSAETLPKGAIQVSTLTGLGRRTGLLGPDHKFNRAIGDIAFAFGIHKAVSLGLTLDGRYDRHWGLAPSGDDGYVGDPKLMVRASSSTGTVAFGGQLGIWIPGKDAPSIAGSAISVDARALVSLPAGPGTLSFAGGIRIDNSANSVDEPLSLSLQDRVSLGVSDYHALLLSAHLSLPMGDKAFVGLEGSLDAFIGGPPEPAMGEIGRAELARGKQIFRGALTAGFHINDSFSAIVFAEMAKVPGINLAQVADNNIPLIPYEPIFTGGIGLQARFGAKNPSRLFDEKDCAKHNPPDCPAVKVPLFTEISGTVIDSAGKPVAGARVTLTLKSSQVEPQVTDATGSYVFKNVPIGSTVEGKSTVEETGVEVNVDLANMKPGKATIAQVAEKSNTVPPITLDPVLPPGELKGYVRNLQGKTVNGATITIEPGGFKVESDADGAFAQQLAPGQYKIKVTANGYKTQELDVTIDPTGVAIKNIDLQK